MDGDTKQRGVKPVPLGLGRVQGVEEGDQVVASGLVPFASSLLGYETLKRVEKAFLIGKRNCKRRMLPPQLVAGLAGHGHGPSPSQ